MTMSVVHQLSERVLDLEATPGLREQPGFAAWLTDAAVSALAQVACAHADLTGSADSRLDALSALEAARESLGTVTALLEDCRTRGYASADEMGDILEAAHEAAALVLAQSMAVRCWDRQVPLAA